MSREPCVPARVASDAHRHGTPTPRAPAPRPPPRAPTCRLTYRTHICTLRPRSGARAHPWWPLRGPSGSWGRGQPGCPPTRTPPAAGPPFARLVCFSVLCIGRGFQSTSGLFTELSKNALSPLQASLPEGSGTCPSLLWPTVRCASSSPQLLKGTAGCAPEQDTWGWTQSRQLHCPGASTGPTVQGRCGRVLVCRVGGPPRDQFPRPPRPPGPPAVADLERDLGLGLPRWPLPGPPSLPGASLRPY